MAAELKARKDMDKRYMWDLTQIYKTNEDWEAAFEELQASIPDVGKYSGTMGAPAGAKRYGKNTPLLTASLQQLRTRTA